MFKDLWNRVTGLKTEDPIVIVSGLPRSGTSMMMKMLEAGGLDPLTDNIREPDADNPKGYYEFERVKKLKDGDFSWLDEAKGKVVKVIATLLPYLPDTYQYKVIFMHRSMPEILASQRKMLIRRGEDPNKVPEDQLADLFKRHLSQVDTWIASRANVQKLDVSYNDLLQNPAPHLDRIHLFLDKSVEMEKMGGMIDPKLYRQRKIDQG